MLVLDLASQAETEPQGSFARQKESRCQSVDMSEQEGYHYQEVDATADEVESGVLQAEEVEILSP